MVDSAQTSPIISVIIAAYNCADFVHRAIESACRDQGTEVEIIVVDDCSTDSTVARVQELVRADDRIRLVTHATNSGPSVTRNSGIQAARGKWVAVLDADDAFLPGRLLRLKTIAESSDADIIADNFVYYDAVNKVMGAPGLRTSGSDEVIDLKTFIARARPYTQEADYGLLKPMMKKAFLDVHKLAYPADSRHGEDFLLYLEALRKNAHFRLTREPGYIYTTRDSGLSRTRIDYRGQITSISKLLSDRDLVRDYEVVRLLKERSQALQRLAAQRAIERSMSDKNVMVFAWTSLLNLRHIDIAAKLIRRNLVKNIKKSVKIQRG